MSTFDPMAASIDWLDADREASLSVVDLYASDAVVECGCGGIKGICGRTAITAGELRPRAQVNQQFVTMVKDQPSAL